MTDKQKKMLERLGLKESDFKQKGDVHTMIEVDETALLELADMVATQEEAICELADIVGGMM